MSDERAELKTAYGAYVGANEFDKAYACIEYLYKDYGDYDSVIEFRKKISKKFQKAKNQDLMEMARRSYILTAQNVFDDYMVAMEWDRPMKAKFYIPRRRKLLPIVQAMQDLTDDKLDILGISAPPGIGKTGLGDFYMTFCAGRNPELSILMGSHSNSILNDNYNECLRMLSSDEYNWEEIFKGHSVRKTNAADLKIDIDNPHKFSTFQFGSVGSGLAGKVRAMQLLYCDDLIPNKEVAENRDRLDKLWGQYGVDFKQRMQGDCKEMHIATRWSVHDVLGRLEAMNEDNPRAKFIRIPALNEKGESNFDYGGNIGWTTKKYMEIQETMDDASWKALYMNEPIEREGLLFDAKELNYYYDLPVNEPDAILAVCDTKDRGEDYFSMPVAYQYGDNFYIEKIIFDNSDPKVVIPRLASTLIEYKVKLARFESNSAGGQIAYQVEQKVKEAKGITSISTKYSSAHKETRIIVDSAWIKSHCYFKDRSLWDTEYKKAMAQLNSYSLSGKNKHDDVADSFSMLANFVQSFEVNVITVRQRII